MEAQRGHCVKLSKWSWILLETPGFWRCQSHRITVESNTEWNQLREVCWCHQSSKDWEMPRKPIKAGSARFLSCLLISPHYATFLLFWNGNVYSMPLYSRKKFLFDFTGDSLEVGLVHFCIMRQLQAFGGWGVECGGLNKNGFCRLIYLNTFSWWSCLGKD